MKRFYHITLLAKGPDGGLTYQGTHGWVADPDVVGDDELTYQKVVEEGRKSFGRWGFVPGLADVSVMCYWLGELKPE